MHVLDSLDCNNLNLPRLARIALAVSRKKRALALVPFMMNKTRKACNT